MKTGIDTQVQALAQAEGTNNYRDNLVVLFCPHFVHVYLFIFLL